MSSGGIARKIHKSLLLGLSILVLVTAYAAGPVVASDTQTVASNVLKATSVGAGFDNSLNPVMYVMTVTNGDTNDIVSRLSSTGTLSTFKILPPRTAADLPPIVDVTVVRAAFGEFKNFVNFLLVSRGLNIFLITPQGTIVKTNAGGTVDPTPTTSPFQSLTLVPNCQTINSIVMGSEKFGRRLVVACATGKILSVGTKPGDVVSVTDLDSSIGRIDMAPPNFYNAGENLGRRLLAYKQSNGMLVAFEPGLTVDELLVSPLFAPNTRASVRTIPSLLCAYITDPTPQNGSDDTGTLISTDAAIGPGNKNTIYKSPIGTFQGQQGQVLLIADDGSRVRAQWNPSSPIDSINFQSAHDAGPPVLNGAAFCPYFVVTVDFNPTSVSNPNPAITGGNITFVILSIVVNGVTVFSPQDPNTGVNQSTIRLGLGTGVTTSANCTKSQKDLNGDGVADLQCSGKASQLPSLPPGGTYVVTFKTIGTVDPPSGND